MNFDKEKRYFLSDWRLHDHLREDWLQGGENKEVIEHMINKLINFSHMSDIKILVWDIELTYEREIKIYCCYEGLTNDVDYTITIYPDKFYRRR